MNEHFRGTESVEHVYHRGITFEVATWWETVVYESGRQIDEFMVRANGQTGPMIGACVEDHLDAVWSDDCDAASFGL